MKKYVAIALFTLISTANAGYNKYPEGSILGYDNPKDFFAEKALEKATGKEGQLTFDDYQGHINSLTKREQKKFENTKQDFLKMDYNKDGLVSSDEFKLYNLENLKADKTTKNKARRIKMQKSKGTYKDPAIEIEKLKTKIKEESNKDATKADIK